MSGKQLINVRVTAEEASILSEYADLTGQTQTGIMRQAIRALEPRLRKIDPKTIDPLLLPSLPLVRKDRFPPVGAVYFFITESGEVLYVGETSDLSLRFGNHLKYKQAIEIDGQARLHWMEKRSGRASFESACIKRFLPPLNTFGKQKT